MSDKLLSKIANDTGKALTFQAALAAALTVVGTHFLTSLSPTQIGVIANCLSVPIVWIGRRIINRLDADEAAQEPTRALVLLRDKIEQEAAAMSEDDPRRPQRLAHAQILTEEILRTTVRTHYILWTKQIGSETQPGSGDGEQS